MTTPADIAAGAARAHARTRPSDRAFIGAMHALIVLTAAILGSKDTPPSLAHGVITVEPPCKPVLLGLYPPGTAWCADVLVGPGHDRAIVGELYGDVDGHPMWKRTGTPAPARPANAEEIRRACEEEAAHLLVSAAGGRAHGRYALVFSRRIRPAWEGPSWAEAQEATMDAVTRAVVEHVLQRLNEWAAGLPAGEQWEQPEATTGGVWWYDGNDVTVMATASCGRVEVAAAHNGERRTVTVDASGGRNLPLWQDTALRRLLADAAQAIRNNHNEEEDNSGVHRTGR